MLVLDYSGSMSWDAYISTTSTSELYKKVCLDSYYGFCIKYVYSYYRDNVNYYGFFKEDKYYFSKNGVYWEEENKTDDCWSEFDIDGSLISLTGVCPGKLLNWFYMTRIDILRWILTGGKVTDNYVKTYKGIFIKKDAVSSYDKNTGEVEGILQKLERKKIKPRVGLEIYYSYDGINLNYYLINPSYDYTEVISSINNISPNGGTPTGPALNVMKEFFSRKFSYDPYKFSVSNNVTLEVPCSKNFVLLVSDGEWNVGVDPIVPAYKMWTEDLVPDLRGVQNVKVLTVAAFLDSSEGINALKNIAVVGSFQDKDDNGIPSGYILDKTLNAPLPPDCSVCDSSHEPPCGSFCPLPVDNTGEWDTNGDGIPDNFFSGSDPLELKKSVEKAIEEIVNSIASGTSVCALSEKGKAGNVILQATFYPSRQYQDTNITWVGYLYSWWLYSTRSSQNVREDTNKNRILDLDKDLILQWMIDSTGVLTIEAYNSTSTGGIGDRVTTYYSFDETHPLWEAGEKLAEMEPSERHIKTYVSDDKPSSPQNLVELKDISDPYIFGDDNKNGIIDESSEQYTYAKSISLNDLIQYIYGTDVSGYRVRQTSEGTWKLGDIIYSTPTLVNYGNYTVAFVGANDGMLHAFKVGYVKKLTSPTQIAQLQKTRDPNDIKDEVAKLEPGEEIWAFIPKNVLPYLRFLADPDYKHMYFVDLKPYIYTYTDSSGELHRILIGGMRLGGAVGCTESGCINPPKDTCPDPSSPSCVGLSSYFALDVTHVGVPKFLWEFTDPNLGFTYSGPAVITYDGNRYVMFASGPTDYNGDSVQPLRLFVLQVDDNFNIKKEYVIDRNVSTTFIELNNAFGGRLFTNGIDVDNDGNTDFVFLGVTETIINSTQANSTQQETVDNIWQGNVLGIRINNTDPTKWGYFRVFTSATRPIVSKIEYMKCFGMNYIYFGTGRWFFKFDDSGIPNGLVSSQADNQTQDREYLYGVRIDRCISDWRTCNFETANNQKDICNELEPNSNEDIAAWEIPLDPAETDNNTGIPYMKERAITDPTVVPGYNVVFFTTTQPTADPCGFGGRSRVWGLNCATGSSMFTTGCPETTEGAKYLPQIPPGSLFLQLSSGNVEQITEASFNQTSNSTTEWFVGVAPESSTPFVSPTGWLGELLLWIER
jgi:type IV pilus assembly protein PilY1